MKSKIVSNESELKVVFKKGNLYLYRNNEINKRVVLCTNTVINGDRFNAVVILAADNVDLGVKVYCDNDDYIPFVGKIELIQN